jgi:hypothetical protein
MSNPKTDKSPESYSDEETVERAEAALKRMLATPHQPHNEMKLGRKKRVVESPKSDSTASKKKSGRRPSSRAAKLAALLWDWLGRGALVWRHGNALRPRLRAFPFGNAYHLGISHLTHLLSGARLPLATGSSNPAEESRRRPREAKPDSVAKVESFCAFASAKKRPIRRWRSCRLGGVAQASAKRAPATAPSKPSGHRQDDHCRRFRRGDFWGSSGRTKPDCPRANSTEDCSRRV